MSKPNLDVLGFDDALKGAVAFLTNPPPPPADEPVPPEQGRAFWEAATAVYNRGAPDRPVERNVELREGTDNVLTADIYLPDGAGPHPVVLFIHGGAWTVGSPATHHKLTCRFAEAGYLTISVDYALAPEHPYPAGLGDCLFAADWALAHASLYGGDPDRMAISGDSAGGNLAAAVIAKQLERDGVTSFAAASLLYGAYDWALLARIPVGLPFYDWRSTERSASTYYGGASPSDPGISPACSPHLAGFPPTQLLVGSEDPLLAQSLTFAADLQKMGVGTDLHVYDGMPHGFLQIEEYPACGEALAEVWTFLKAQLAD